MKEFILKYWVEFVFASFIGALSFAYKKLSCKYKKDKEDIVHIKNGLKASLRGDIVQIYNYCKDRGDYCPIYQLENAEALYEAYHSLGGNGTITQLMKEIREMKHSYVKTKEKEET